MLKTTDGQALAVTMLTWQEGFKLLKATQPELVKVLNTVPVKLRRPFYLASYQFGATIINKNGMYLPLADGGEISFNDTSLPKELIQGLSYDRAWSNPVGAILNKKCEYFIQNEQRVIPHMLLHPGEMIGLSTVLKNAVGQTPKASSAFLWDLTAGARSIFMVSKIGDKPRHKKLKIHYNLSLEAPQNYEEHWHVFKEIARNAKSPWRAEILFFDKQWIDLLKHPQYGAHLYMQLSVIHNPTHNKIWHHIPSWDSIYGEIELKKGLTKYDLEVINIVKHLFAIVAQCALGLRPAVDEDAAPIKLLQTAYAIYGLEYYPIIMEPALFSPKDKLAVYYSANYATLPQFSPAKNTSGRRVITTTENVETVLKFYRSYIIKAAEHVRSDSLKEAVFNADFSFYHDNHKNFGSIKDIISLVEEDPRFSEGYTGKFPQNGSFFVGLIKITPIKK